MNDDEERSLRTSFAEAVNMAPQELEDWLETDESKRVGQKDGDSESVGHASGRRIVEIKRKRKDELTDADYRHMRDVIGYVKRHAAQRPSHIDEAELATSRWRYSLMNWGHDPLHGKGGER